MKNLKTIYIALLTIIVAACNDDLDMPVFNGIGEDGSVEFSLSVPELQKIATRAGNDELVNNVSVLIFENDNENAAVKQIENFDLSSQSDPYKIRIIINKTLRGNKDVIFYFIANSATSFEKDKTTISDLRQRMEYEIEKEGVVVMSAKASVNNLSKTVELVRNAAYVTVTDDNETNSHAYPFAIMGASSSSALAAGAETNGESVSDYIGIPAAGYDFESVACSEEGKYIHPTLNTKGSSGNMTYDYEKKSYIIVKAQYPEGGTEYYYRLDLQQNTGTDEDPQVKVLDLLPNHWYQVMIKAVTGAGYATPEEASKNPSPYVDYVIHDHSPKIFNMVSDGVRELGVSHEIEYTNGNSVEGDESTFRYLYIKVYSKEKSDYETGGNDLTLNNLTWEEDWLTVNAPVEVTDPEEIDDQWENEDHKGKVYKVKLAFHSDGQLGSLEDEITVTWKGLTRKVPVAWVRQFHGSALCDISLTIRNAVGTEVSTIGDYWGFLESSDEGSNYTGAKLYGVSESQNNGRIRNQGLHFPVMYGKSDKRIDGEWKAWSYSYNVDMTALKKRDFKWSFQIKPKSGYENMKHHITIKMNGSPITEGTEYVHTSGSELKLTFERPGNAVPSQDGTDGDAENDYSYWAGEFIMTFSTSESKTESKANTRYSFDLYHCGFFHKSSEKAESHRVGDADSENYYYYEVVPIMGATRMRYWLDRNLGAKSAEMYVEATGGMPYHGNREAAGGYYKVAAYKKYDNPIMYDEDESDRVSPPGYRVPKQKVWNALRNSNLFSTSMVGSYYNARYRCQVGAGSNYIDVFFPKAMYMEGNVKSGESRGGYYWTQTAATGTEKEETGNWLKALSISGNSTSYFFGKVEGKPNDSNPYAMSVRCINDIDDDNTPHRTSFMVSGATHVYLYYISGGKKVGVTTWPGQSIGDHNTMTNGWFNFSYESDNLSAEKFYVIFNFKDGKGIIHSFSQKDGNTLVSTDKGPNDLTGWEVKDGSYPELVDPDNNPASPGNPTDTGYWWRCNTTTFSVYCYQTEPGTGSFRLYWPKSKGAWLNLWYSDNKGVVGYPINGISSDIRGYYYASFTASDMTLKLNLRYENFDPTIELFTLNSFEKIANDSYYSAYIDINGNKNGGKPQPLAKYEFENGDKVRIKWKNSGNKTHIHIWYTDDPGAVTVWPGSEALVEGDYRYYDITVEGNHSEINYLRTNGINNIDGNRKFLWRDVQEDSSIGGYVYVISD